MPDLTHRLNKAKEYIKKTKDTNQANKKHILKFVDRLSAEGLSKARQIKYIYNLKTISKLLGKDFDKVAKSDSEISFDSSEGFEILGVEALSDVDE